MTNSSDFFNPPCTRIVLSRREVEVAGLVAEGWNNTEISKRLYIEVKTVEHHLHAIYMKMTAQFDCRGRNFRSYLGVLFRAVTSEDTQKSVDQEAQK